MAYTVKALAKLSGVTVRTLHWYDEIGLLKPAYYGSNGYRYYEEEQLLLLQQLLFFRELGFSLSEIQRVVTRSDFDKVRALRAHQRTLEKGLEQTQELLKTIRKTILHLQGEQKMNNKQFYAGFSEGNQKGVFLAEYRGTLAEDLVHQSKKETKELTKDEVEKLTAIYLAVATCIDQGLTPKSDKVQALMQQHCELLEQVHHLTKEVYLSYAQLYCEHPDFRKWFDPHHPQLAGFFAEAMRVYAHHKLK